MADAFHARQNAAVKRRVCRDRRDCHPAAWRCDMMPSIEICLYCSHKIEEKEKSVNLPAGVAHLACAQKATNEGVIEAPTRTKAS
jgi:hypothetical protein